MIPGVFSQVFIHLVFSPHLHCPVQSINLQERLFKYISGVVNTLGHKSLAVNGMYDHIHIFYSMKPSIDISSTVKEIKRLSSKFLHDEVLLKKFDWQEGYGAFSYSRSQVDTVVKYILNQREHHRIKTFRAEYIAFLESFEIEFNQKYLFAFHE